MEEGVGKVVEKIISLFSRPRAEKDIWSWHNNSKNSKIKTFGEKEIL